MKGKVTVIAHRRAKPGTEHALREALLAVCAPTRAEKDCINYDLHDSLDRCSCSSKIGSARPISTPICNQRISPPSAL